MKYFILLLLLFQNLNCSDYSIEKHIIQNLKKGGISIEDRPVKNIAKYIKKYSIKYKIPANIFTAILMQESTYLLSAKNCYEEKKTIKNPSLVGLITMCDFQYSGINFEKCLLDIPITITIQERVCTDFGISQIHIATAKLEGYSFDIDKLTTDLEYSIESGIKVLSYFHKRYSKKEKDWWVRYNCGAVKNIDTSKTCQTYKKMVSRFF
jgi:hypothetical protein